MVEFIHQAVFLIGAIVTSATLCMVLVIGAAIMIDAILAAVFAFRVDREVQKAQGRKPIRDRLTRARSIFLFGFHSANSAPWIDVKDGYRVYWPGFRPDVSAEEALG